MAANKVTKKAISERISIFEQKTSSPSPSHPKLPATRTLSTKNFHALKSQFDTSGNQSLTSPPPTPTSPPPSSFHEQQSPPPPPPPRTLPPESPPEVPRRSSVASNSGSKATPTPATKTPVKKSPPSSKGSSPPSSGKVSPTSRGGRKSPPGANNNNKTPTAASRSPTKPKSNNGTTPVKKKVVSSSATTPVNSPAVKAAAGANKNSSSSKKPATRTLSSPLNVKQQQQQPQVPKQEPQQQQPRKKSSVVVVGQSSPQPTPSSDVTDNAGVVSTEADEVNANVILKEVSLNFKPPSSTSTPVLQPKPPTTEVFIEEEVVVNKNFKNSIIVNSMSSVTSGGVGNQYWTNQALQNENSQKISKVQLQGMHVSVMDDDIRSNTTPTTTDTSTRTINSNLVCPPSLLSFHSINPFFAIHAGHKCLSI